MSQPVLKYLIGFCNFDFRSSEEVFVAGRREEMADQSGYESHVALGQKEASVWAGVVRVASLRYMTILLQSDILSETKI
jgi:hypothetical protein